MVSNVDCLAIIDNKFILTQKIGSGGTSKVYLGYDIEDIERKNLYAIKLVHTKMNKDEEKYFLTEIQSLQKIQDPNVVSIIGGNEGILTKNNKKKYLVKYIVLEYVRYGELFDYIFFPQKGFGEELGKYIFVQLVNALDACHKVGVSHRDVKTENVMLGENWVIKLADFGFSTLSQGKFGDGLLYTSLGTASYASPELLLKKPYYGVMSDIFSLGVAMFVLVTGKMPFKHAHPEDNYYKEVCNGNFDEYWEKLRTKTPTTSLEFKKLFFMLISFDATQRPSLEEIRESEWLAGYVPNMEYIDNEFKQRREVVEYCKEQERLREENTNTGNDRLYRSTDKNVVIDHDCDEELNIEMYKDINNPYTIKFKNYAANELLGLINNKLAQYSNVIAEIDNEKKQRITLKVQEDDKVEINKSFIIADFSLTLEVKMDEESNLLIVFKRIAGSKYDFFNFFKELEADIF